MKEYYTYAYLREDGTPYYIGKGKGNRAYKKHKIGTPPKNKILFLKKGLTEEQAFLHEMYMISILGRKNLGTGILENKNAGGNGSSGKVYSQEEKDKIRKDVLGRKWWNNGIENSQSKECPGDGWVIGRIITWDEPQRLKNMKYSCSKIIYKFVHNSGEVVYCNNLNQFKKVLGTDAFYKLLYKKQEFYKGWICVEKCNEDAIETLNLQRIIELTNSYKGKTYKITHITGKIMYINDTLTSIGKKFGCKDGFYRLFNKTRKSYKGWISVEVI